MPRRLRLDPRRLPADVAPRLSETIARADPAVREQIPSRTARSAFERRWRGVILGVQPRIRMLRSFDQRSHSYLGYSLLVRGIIGDHLRDFLVGVGKAAHAKYQFQAGDTVSGLCEPVADPRLETVDFYMVSGIEIEARRADDPPSPPPWEGLAPDLPTYRARGHRRLSGQTYTADCMSCIWGCHMAVEMIIDQWNPSEKQYRTEKFCYGPKSCAAYRPGPRRVVPGRKGMKHVEEDWVDADATSRRGDDD